MNNWINLKRRDDVVKAQDYLSQVYHLEEKIKKLKLDIEEYKRLATELPGSDYDSVKVDCTRTNDAPFKKWIIKAADLEIDLKALEEKYPILKNEVIATIDSIQDSDLKRVLFYRYIDRMSWNQIADKVCVSVPTIFRYHKNGLKKIKVPVKIDS